MSYFYAFNGIFFVWTIMALLYFIYNTLNVSCSGSISSLYLVQHFFIAWTCSYGFEALVPLVCIYSGREAKHYMTSYVFLALATIFKLAVLGSLIVGAWATHRALLHPLNLQTDHSSDKLPGNSLPADRYGVDSPDQGSQPLDPD